jgi:alkylation response protein AidB-like acyl-CoA dehydrogenase
LFVLDPDADVVFVATRDRAVYAVDAGAEGLESLVQTTVDRTRRAGELRFNRTPAQLITNDRVRVGGLLDTARVMLAADTLGAAQYMLDAAVAYAKERRQFGRTIGSFQAVKHLCAEMAAELEPCRAMLWYAAHALSEIPAEACVMACHTKAHLAEVGTFVAKTATEVHGGIGFTDLLGLPYWFKRIGFNRQCLGAPELVREEAAVAQGFQ